MVPSKRMEEALNAQMMAEIYSAHLYLAMAAYFASKDLPGFTSWMKAQAEEELAHAGRFFDFLLDRGARVRVGEVQAPPQEWDSPLSAFEAALSHERSVTQRIHSLVDLAREERDHASDVFLQWFVREQVEEEASVEQVVKRLAMLRDAPHALFMLDQRLGERKTSSEKEEEWF